MSLTPSPAAAPCSIREVLPAPAGGSVLHGPGAGSLTVDLTGVDLGVALSVALYVVSSVALSGAL